MFLSYLERNSKYEVLYLVMKDARHSVSKTSELVMEASLSVLCRDKALVTPVRLVTLLEEFRGSLESSSATALALRCEVGNWNHSRLVDTHTKLDGCFCVILEAATGLQCRHGETA